MLPFLKYINDPEHERVCCIGVPYKTRIWQVGDASGLNGAFKIALSKAKREYLKHRDRPNFEPTDLVPLLNKSWERSFNNKSNALKAITYRGWNPLNFNLLDCLKASEGMVVDLTTENNGRVLPPPLPRPKINKGIGSYYMDKLLEEERKSKGRIEKFKKLKIEMKTREEKVEYFKKLTKISSAQLASNNHYTLDKMVLDRVQEKHDHAEEEKKVAEQKRHDKQRAADEKFYKTAQKFVDGWLLTVDDMKCLILRVKNNSDSPAKSKKADVEQQFYNRKQRIEDIVSTL